MYICHSSTDKTAMNPIKKLQENPNCEILQLKNTVHSRIQIYEITRKEISFYEC